MMLRLANSELRLANSELRLANFEFRLANFELRLANFRLGSSGSLVPLLRQIRVTKQPLELQNVTPRLYFTGVCRYYCPHASGHILAHTASFELRFEEAAREVHALTKSYAENAYL